MSYLLLVRELRACPKVYPFGNAAFTSRSSKRSTLERCNYTAWATSAGAPPNTGVLFLASRQMARSLTSGATCERAWTVTTWRTCPAVSAAGPGRRSAILPAVTPPVSSSGGTSTSSLSCAREPRSGRRLATWEPKIIDGGDSCHPMSRHHDRWIP